MSEDLSQFDRDFQEAEEIQGYQPPPPGEYTAKITGARFDRTGEKNEMKLLWDFEDIATGRKILKNSSLSQAAMGFLKADLRTVGITAPTLTAVNAELPRIIGMTIKVKVHEKKGFTNVDILEVVGAPGPATGNAGGNGQTAPAQPSQQAATQQDDIPF